MEIILIIFIVLVALAFIGFVIFASIFLLWFFIQQFREYCQRKKGQGKSETPILDRLYERSKEDMLFLIPMPVRIAIDILLGVVIFYCFVLYPIFCIAETGYTVWMDYVLIPIGILLSVMLVVFANKAMKKIKK